VISEALGGEGLFGGSPLSFVLCRIKMPYVGCGELTDFFCVFLLSAAIIENGVSSD